MRYDGCCALFASPGLGDGRRGAGSEQMQVPPFQDLPLHLLSGLQSDGRRLHRLAAKAPVVLLEMRTGPIHYSVGRHSGEPVGVSPALNAKEGMWLSRDEAGGALFPGQWSYSARDHRQSSHASS